MAQLFDIRNLLRRDGTSQAQRQLPALDPANVKVDERAVEDFLVFALRFARQVIYYDHDSQKHGDWTPFFACDTSVLIASIEKTNPLPLKKALHAELEAPPTSESLQNLFTLLTELARQIDDWNTDLASWSGLKGKIANLIRANLSTFLGRLVGYEKGVVNTLDGYEGVGADRYAGFGPAWNLSDPNAVAPDTGLFGGAETEEAQILAARETLSEQFTVLYNVLLEIIGLAATFFEASITDQPSHEPHTALFIAFLKLYLQVRDDGNKLAERHLDFYYKDVLQLKTKDAVPDSVHLFFQLARQRNEYKIDAGTALDAGKDAIGVKRVYTMEDDLVATVAQIDSFRTVFVDYDRSAEDFPDTKAIQRVYAAPVANSQDGLGAEIEDKEKPSWKTLGSAAMPPATIGFAVASRALLLAEGTRTITITLHCDSLSNTLTATALSNAFFVAFSAEKGWIEPDLDAVTVTLDDGAAETGAGILTLVVTLQPTDDPITFFDAEALGEDYGTTLPLVKVILRQPDDDATAYAYEALKSLALQRITLATQVDGVQTLIVENDQFVMDAGKPFQPFGLLPDVGANFYVGSGEVFGKKLTALDLVVEWDALPDTFAAHYEGYYDPAKPPATPDFRAAVSLLQDAEWKPDPVTATETLFEEDAGRLASTRTISLAASVLSVQEPRVLDVLKPRSLASQNGFLRLTLTPRNFFHGDYANVLTRQALATGKLPTEIVGAHYRLNTYTFSVLDDEGAYLLVSETKTYTNEAAAQTGYQALLALAADDAHYVPLGAGPGLFGFTLVDAVNRIIATHPTLYTSEKGRDAAITSIIAAVGKGTVRPVIRQAIYRGGTQTPSLFNAATSEVVIPNEPYTPTIKSLRLNYSASLDSEAYADQIEFIHILPFGYERIPIPSDAAVLEAEEEGDTSVAKPFLVPPFDDEGTLYLGLKNLKPLQSLSILFQVAESTADTDLEKASVTWSYLANKGWIPFEDYEITADTTQDLIASGIVTFTIPRALTSGNTRLPAINSDDEALYWIKAAVPINAGAVSELINAHTQAVKATFADQGNDPDHLKTPLPAETIGALVNADASIDSVNQRYDSFGGQPAEAGVAFYIRISERLRHKGRAITLFDYERLVLEHFPGIYKVKCINHSNDQHELAPGHVLIAVIPDFTSLKAVDRRAPKVTFDTLDDIKTFLSSVNCPFVRSDTGACNTLHVLNPLYEEVKVAFKVKFRPDVTAIGFYKRALNAAIIRFLSPWAFDEGGEINFGGKVYKSSILNFVEEQDYVDYVVDFRMMHDGATDDVDEIEAGTPRSILIPADDHDIEAVTGEYCVLEHALSHDGIGQMTLHQDFEVD